MKCALIGNPNSGKTTLFNQLTGSNAKVGNWAGVTVEKKEGSIIYENNEIEIVDLPGIYSLSPFSEEEKVARNFLLGDDFDVIINIIDVSNLERNLYLTTQLLELGKPLILALNMIDSHKYNGGHINILELEKRLNLKCVGICASKNIGINALLSETLHINKVNKFNEKTVIINSEISDLILDIRNILSKNNIEKPLFCSIKYLDGDEEYTKKFASIDFSGILSQTNKEFDIIIAEQRYKFIEETLIGIYSHSKTVFEETLSDKIDKVVTHKYFGIPIFFFVMFLVFSITFGKLGTFFQNSVSNIMTGVLPVYAEYFLTHLGVSFTLKSLIINGIINGVGMLFTFLPQILMIFLFLSFLEDIGYMSRATFLMDNLLRKIGLSGKAFVPMLMGFGCSVPAILATRTLESKRDRNLCIILTPFMSCGARLPVYVFFASYFFKENATIAIFCIYILGILVAILSGLILKSSVFMGESSSYIMELSPYRLPVLKNVYLNISDRAKEFIERAFTLLLISSIIIWFLQSFDKSLKFVTDNSQSIFCDIGKLIAPIFTPLGFGNWQASVSLLTGFIAKESIISTMEILFNSNNISLTSFFTTPQAISFVVFVSLYTPCIVAVTTIRKEMESLSLTLFAITYHTLTAYIVSFIIYNISIFVMR